MFKNPTPHVFASLFALCFGFTSCVLIYIVTEFFPTGKVTGLFLAMVLVTLIAYVFLRQFLSRYIYRKIKPLYKLIKRTKVSTVDKETVSLQEDVFGKVEQEVTDWVEHREEELNNLRQLEDYRKQFIGNVSHELKTPLFSIQGFIETLAENNLSADRREFYFDRTKNNIDRLITIVDDLDVISSMDSGGIEMEMTETNLVELVKEVLSDLEKLAAESNVNLALKPGMETIGKVLVDRESIRQVLINLVMNSIKYGREGGETKVGFYDVGPDILVEVSDNGMGIEEKHLKHLFDRFYRVDRSRSRKAGGSGLGLSIVKHIIEAHGQTINVRSTIGQGSTFGFTLKKANTNS